MTRLLRPNQNGIVIPQSPQLHVASPLKMLKQPTNALMRLHKISEGKQLLIMVERMAGGIGDVLMTLPTVRAIKKKYNCVLHYSTDFDYLAGALPKVLEGNPYIDKVLNWRDITKDEDREIYDGIINLTCPCTVHEQPHAPPINRIDLFARHAQIHLDDFSIDYTITPQELEWGKQFIASRGCDKYKLIMVNTHSSTARRDLPVEKLQRALMGILGARKDVRAIIITHSTDSNKRQWNLYGTTEMKDYDVRHIAAVMFYCDLVLCQDSALLHLAGALHKKIVTFFGPTDPRARVDHYEHSVAICPGRHLKCHPSWYANGSNCGMTCWKLFQEQLIIDTSLAMLNNEALPKSDDLVYFGNPSGVNGPSQQLFEVL